MQHSSKNTALAFLLGALLTGGALGFTAARMMGRASPEDRTYATVKDQLARTLELSPEQQATFDSIVARRDRTLDSIYAPLDAQWEALKPAGTAVRERARAELRATLSVTQQREFDHYVAVMKAREAKRDSMERARRQARAAQPGAAADSAVASTRSLRPQDD